MGRSYRSLAPSPSPERGPANATFLALSSGRAKPTLASGCADSIDAARCSQTGNTVASESASERRIRR
jgi:hypothetical protein